MSLHIMIQVSILITQITHNKRIRQWYANIPLVLANPVETKKTYFQIRYSNPICFSHSKQWKLHIKLNRCGKVKKTHSLSTITLLSSRTLWRVSKQSVNRRPIADKRLKVIFICIIHTALPVGPIIPMGPITPPLPWWGNTIVWKSRIWRCQRISSMYSMALILPLFLVAPSVHVCPLAQSLLEAPRNSHDKYLYIISVHLFKTVIFDIG